MGATAVSGSLTAVNPGGAGFVRAWAEGGTEPQATLLNYPLTSTGTGFTVAINPADENSMAVKNYGGPTDLVIDVTGYYTRQLQAYVASSGAITNQSGRLVSAINSTPGQYTLTWDRDVTTCAVQITTDFTAHYASALNSGATTKVRIYGTSAALVNYAFYATIDC
ncbi:MAG: hypothetical protein JWM47_1694 [Acidimicrobiales bacterium]|nr:hypothetical protein [Acidimicrobiales bacterium]